MQLKNLANQDQKLEVIKIFLNKMEVFKQFKEDNEKQNLIAQAALKFLEEREVELTNGNVMKLHIHDKIKSALMDVYLDELLKKYPEQLSKFRNRLHLDNPSLTPEQLSEKIETVKEIVKICQKINPEIAKQLAKDLSNILQDQAEKKSEDDVGHHNKVTFKIIRDDSGEELAVSDIPEDTPEGSSPSVITISEAVGKTFLGILHQVELEDNFEDVMGYKSINEKLHEERFLSSFGPHPD